MHLDFSKAIIDKDLASLENCLNHQVPLSTSVIQGLNHTRTADHHVILSLLSNQWHEGWDLCLRYRPELLKMNLLWWQSIYLADPYFVKTFLNDNPAHGVTPNEMDNLPSWVLMELLNPPSGDLLNLDDYADTLFMLQRYGADPYQPKPGSAMKMMLQQLFKQHWHETWTWLLENLPDLHEHDILWWQEKDVNMHDFKQRVFDYYEDGPLPHPLSPVLQPHESHVRHVYGFLKQFPLSELYPQYSQYRKDDQSDAGHTPWTRAMHFYQYQLIRSLMPMNWMDIYRQPRSFKGLSDLKKRAMLGFGEQSKQGDPNAQRIWFYFLNQHAVNWALYTQDFLLSEVDLIWFHQRTPEHRKDIWQYWKNNPLHGRTALHEMIVLKDDPLVMKTLVLAQEEFPELFDDWQTPDDEGLSPADLWTLQDAEQDEVLLNPPRFFLPSC